MRTSARRRACRVAVRSSFEHPHEAAPRHLLEELEDVPPKLLCGSIEVLPLQLLDDAVDRELAVAELEDVRGGRVQGEPPLRVQEQGPSRRPIESQTRLLCEGAIGVPRDYVCC